MPEFSNLKKVINQWGGTTATFFTYTHMSHDLCTGLLPALLPLIRAGLRLSYLQSGLLLSAFTITSGISQFPGGWLGDRYSRHIVVAIGLAGISLAALAIGLSSGYYPMLIILVIMGIFAGAYHPSATSMLSSYFEESRRGKVIALHMLGGSIGFTLGPVLGGLIAGTIGWRFAYIILCVPTLLAAILVLKVLKKFKSQEYAGGSDVISRASTTDGASPEPRQPRMGIGQVLRPIAFATALAILSQLISGSAMAFIPIYLVDKHSVAPAYAAMLMGVVRGGGIAGSLFGGWLSDKWGRKNALVLALVAIGPILYLLSKLPFNLVLMVVFLLFGFLMYMRQVTVQPLLMDSTPPHLRATVFGIYFGLSMEGMSLMQPVAGHFMDIYGITEVFHYIALASIALSLATLLLVKRPRVRR